MREWIGEVEISVCNEAVLKALIPEVTNPPPTSRTSLEVKGSKIVIKAKDASALRAAVNSFMYWIYSASESLKAVEE